MENQTMENQTKPIQDGDIIEYAREDAGISIDSEDLYLTPGEVLMVGDDVDAEMGQLLVDRGFCRLQVLEEAKQEEAPKVEAASLPKQAQEEPPTNEPENTDKLATEGPPSETQTPSAEAAA